MSIQGDPAMTHDDSANDGMAFLESEHGMFGMVTALIVQP
jgi:hypothetical protein